MNEAETRAELIDPKLKESGWGVTEGSKILREFQITAGKIQTGGGRAKPLIADYVLVYLGRKLATMEAKSDERDVGEGVAQAKNYAEKMHLDYTYASNGKEIYQICMQTGAEGLIGAFPTPDDLWKKTFATQNLWQDKFNQVPFEDVGGTKIARYYQEIAVNNAMAAIAEGKQRILLTMATGTGKTFIAFQIAWKLFQTRWNLKRDGSRRPRILFLADRNILADQAFNAFSAFPEDALVRIKPGEISKKGKVPTNGSIFFTIFQTFMSGKDNQPYFGQYPPDYFDFVIIDECHRGGANDEGNWRGIMEYFSPAVQLGLTATPKRLENADTYKYFGDPVYIYSLKEGINDGFLTPFKVKRIQTTLDDYIYTSDDHIIEGEVEEGKIYTEPDFNRIIEIKEREAKRVKIFLSEVDQSEKSIIFCATQDHALAVRDLINQNKKSKEPNYCVRVTANDGALGDQYLEEFRDNEKTIPTILTTSQKLSTGVDARNIRNIVLMRPINSMIEFKQIIGRGTRLFDGKEYFTIYDFVNAYHHFADPEWDGEPITPEPTQSTKTTTKWKEPGESYNGSPETGEIDKFKKVKIKLRDGKEREIQHIISTSFWSPNGKPISAEEFLQNLFGTLPEFFKSEDELRRIWSDPVTRKALLEKLGAAGYGRDILTTIQRIIDAEKSDLYDVLEYISFAVKPITRERRVARAQSHIFAQMNYQQKEFLEFVLSKYIETGVEELDQEKLPDLLTLKYHALDDAKRILGGVENIRNIFIGFQKYLYMGTAA
ncbi:MAG: DEAD/DEAH box helicase family protein [Dehalococcoidia bacterium]|jgi:type I restriction enzyme R subunit